MELILRKKKATIQDYMKLPEGAAYQLIEGQLINEPSPNYGHQHVSMELSSQIHLHVKKNQLGRVLTAPFDIHLDDENIFQPDIVFISNANLPNIHDDGYYHGAPDLVIEIISPGSAYYDLKKKKRIYEKFGVTEYFVVDPEEKEVTRFSLKGNKLEESSSTISSLLSDLLKMEFTF